MSSISTILRKKNSYTFIHIKDVSHYPISTTNAFGYHQQLRKPFADQLSLRNDIIPLENINEEVQTNVNSTTNNNEVIEKKYPDCLNVIDDYEIEELYGSKQNVNKKCCTKQNCSRCCRKFVAFMISRVGLLILTVGYVLAGALIFQELEAENEKRSIETANKIVEDMVSKIYNRVRESSIDLASDEFGQFLEYEIEFFRSFVTNGTMNGTLSGSKVRQWHYFGAVFYTVTLLSTIGYGHITCKTRNGKVFTIIYSAIGIPLMMLFLANIGSSTATLFKFIYLKISSLKRKYKISKFSKQNIKNFDFDCQLIPHNASLFEFSHQEFEKIDDIISSSSTSNQIETKRKPNMNQLYDKQTDNNNNNNHNNSNNTCTECKNCKVALNNNSQKKLSNSTYNNNNSNKNNSLYLNAPNLHKPSHSDNDIYESSLYARHIETKNKPINRFDLTDTINYSIGYNSLNNVSQFLANRDLTADSIGTNASIDYSRASKSALISKTSSNSKLSEAMKRIDDLISGEMLSTPTSPTILKESSNTELSDKKSLKTVNFKEHTNTNVHEAAAVESDDDQVFAIGEDESAAEKKEVENVVTEVQETTNKTDVIKKDEKPKKLPLFKRFSIRNKSSVKSKEQKSKSKSTGTNPSISEAISAEASPTPRKIKESASEPKFFTGKLTSDSKISDSNSEKPLLGSTTSSRLSVKEQKSVNKAEKSKSKKDSHKLSTEASIKPATTNEKEDPPITPSVTTHINQSYHTPFKRNQTKSLNYRSKGHRISNPRLSHQLSYSETMFDKRVSLYPNVKKLAFNKRQLQYIYSEFEQREREEIGVPFVITLVIMPLYLVAGMILFSIFENWKTLDAFYFAFVTVTTIGFGDFIPGSTLSVDASKLHMCISALYIFIGLVLIAMCFNLMKYQFKSKVKMIARKFGLSQC